MTLPAQRPVFRTLAAVAAISLAGAAFAAPAHAAEVVVTIKLAQYPQLIDSAGATNDAIRLFRVPGAQWKVDGEVVEVPGAAFDHKLEVPETGERTAAVVTLHPLTSDPLNTYKLGSGPTTWKMKEATDIPVLEIDGGAVKPAFNDAPGVKSDSVTFPRLPGVVWKVAVSDADGAAVASYAEPDFKAKDTLVVKLTRGTEVVTADTTAANLKAGTAAPAFSNTLTSASTIAYTEDALDESIEPGDNPWDPWKGFGKGASVETVKITGVAGVKYQVGSKKPVAVKGVAYLPVDPSDFDANGNVVVKVASANANYGVPSDYAKSVPLKDVDTAGVTIKPAALTEAAKDLGGAPKDTLVLPGQRNMTWHVGQLNAKTGKWVYTAQKIGKDGNVTYKVKHSKVAAADIATATTPVRVRPVADRGYVLDLAGWNSNAETQEFTFSQKNVEVGSDKLGTVGDKAVTLDADPGVLSWVITDTVPSGTTSKVVKSTYKSADLEKLGIDSLVVPVEDANATVIAKLQKFYEAAPAPVAP